MTYVTDQTSAELRAHMRRLKAMAGWHEPLADRLFKEILELDAQVNALRAAAAEVPDGWHDPKLPEHDLMPFSFVGLSEHAKEAAREYAETYARKALAAAPAAAVPAPVDARWCNFCGEGVTTFCRGKLIEGQVCQADLAALPQSPRAAPSQEVPDDRYCETCERSVSEPCNSAGCSTPEDGKWEGSALGQQVAKAQAEIATWSPRRLANCQLQGEDPYARTASPPPVTAAEPSESPRAAEPVDMILHCPKCHLQHVDAPSPTDGQDLKMWSNPPHRSHLCRPEDGGCGFIWRPADVPTNGVAAIKTTGKADSAAPPAAQPESAHVPSDASVLAITTDTQEPAEVEGIRSTPYGFLVSAKGRLPYKFKGERADIRLALRPAQPEAEPTRVHEPRWYGDKPAAPVQPVAEKPLLWIGKHPRTGCTEYSETEPSPSPKRDFKFRPVYERAAAEPSATSAPAAQPDAKDATRLDWIEQRANDKGAQVQIARSLFGSGYEIATGKTVKVLTGTLRDALDAAIAAAQEAQQP